MIKYSVTKKMNILTELKNSSTTEDAEKIMKEHNLSWEEIDQWLRSYQKFGYRGLRCLAAGKGMRV